MKWLKKPWPQATQMTVHADEVAWIDGRCPCGSTFIPDGYLPTYREQDVLLLADNMLDEVVDDVWLRVETRLQNAPLSGASLLCGACLWG